MRRLAHDNDAVCLASSIRYLLSMLSLHRRVLRDLNYPFAIRDRLRRALDVDCKGRRDISCRESSLLPKNK